MKYLFALLVFSVCTMQVCAQSLSLFDVDASNFPTMKAKFYAFDSVAKQQRPSDNELILTESGLQRTITNVSCPQAEPPKALSSIVVIDISSSMGSLSGSTDRLNIARNAASKWVNGLPLGVSECAITTFNGFNYLNQDYTTNKSKLIKAISPLTPQDGTNHNSAYNSAFIDSMAGALIMSTKGKYQKVVVLLTDGIGGGTENKIFMEANNQNCIIYCISIGRPASGILKNLANHTGGQTFENVTTVEEAEEVINKILHITQGESYCEITWTSNLSCERDRRTIELKWQNQKSQVLYTPPSAAFAMLSVTPEFITFGKQPPTTTIDRTLILTAQNEDFNIIGH